MGQPSIDALQRETCVADDTEYVVGIHVIPVHGFLVGSGQHHLGAPTFALGSSMGVKRLCREVLRLRKDIVIKIRQYGRVEADIILDQQNHLHTSLFDVVLYVHLVLNQLDNRKDEVGISQPAEHIVEDGHVFVLDAFGDTMREGRQHHTRYVGCHFLDDTRYGKGIVIGITWHTDDQVDVGRSQQLTSLVSG